MPIIQRDTDHGNNQETAVVVFFLQPIEASLPPAPRAPLIRSIEHDQSTRHQTSRSKAFRFLADKPGDTLAPTMPDQEKMMGFTLSIGSGFSFL